jgi:hypothetical protein
MGGIAALSLTLASDGSEYMSMSEFGRIKQNHKKIINGKIQQEKIPKCTTLLLILAFTYKCYCVQF